MSWIQIVVAEGISSQVESNHQKSKTAVAEEAVSIKERLNNSSENVANSVKGEFGNQVREAIKIESEKMNKL